MLKKQGWKLITDPTSLIAQVMKATYYPRSDFMQAELGAHPSFTWRSIWGARKILESRIRWRIGDGNYVNIWNDTWLPYPRDEKL